MTAIALHVASKLPPAEGWIAAAPCTCGPGSEYDHDLPAYLRATRRLRVLIRDDQKVQAALANCARCPFTDACLERTAPTVSFYDGVCGGLVFLNGVVIGGLTEQMRRIA